MGADEDTLVSAGHDHGATDRPLSLLEQADLPLRPGPANWYERRRRDAPHDGALRPAGCVALPLELLADDLPRSVPEDDPSDAPSVPGGPREVVLEDAPRLRRFSGARVKPANFTQIYDGESRRLFRDSSVPWVWVGQISANGIGTGALVGASTVLTAAHVVHGSWSPGRPVTGGPTFTPALFGGTSLLGSRWSANIVGIAAWADVDDVLGYDMAVCQLDQPLGRWLGSFGARTYDDDWEDLRVWTHVGYPYDLSPGGDIPCVERGIAVLDDDSDTYGTVEVETRADIASGQSGGPLWGYFAEGGRQIIGDLSGREDDSDEPKDSLFAGGRGLVRLVQWARVNWG